MTVEDSEQQSASIDSDEYRIKVNDNESPIVNNFAADKSSITLKSSEKDSPITVTFTAEITDNVGFKSISFPNATGPTISGNTYSWTKLFDYDNYDYGSEDVNNELTVIDTNNNTTVKRVTVEVVKTDDEKPTITSFTSDIQTVNLTTNSPSQEIVLTAVASDNVGITQYNVAGATFDSKNGNSYIWRKTLNYDDFNFGDQEATFTVVMKDAALNTKELDEIISVIKSDDQNPSIDSFTASATTVALPSTTKDTPVTVTFAAEVSDNENIASVTLSGGVEARQGMSKMKKGTISDLLNINVY